MPYHAEDISGGVTPAFRAVGETVSQDTTWASIDLALDRFVFRGETLLFNQDRSSSFVELEFQQSYVQVGFYATEKFRIYAQYEEGTGDVNAAEFSRLFGGFPVTQDLDVTFRTDTGIALNYLFSPNVVLKLEHHFDVDNEQFTFVPGPTGLTPVIATAKDGEYSIVSLSASF